MVGTSVSHYRILASIGAGGMGVVYLAEDERLHRKVALKFLPPAIAQDGHSRARLLREAQAASALDHPNVATVYDIGEWNGQLFIAMPFYDGQTLRQRIEHGPLAIDETARIAGELAAGLAAAHAAGIVHRDLKPANVMLTHTTQIPMFRLFGAPESQKRRVVYDTGHNIPRPDLIRESLDWFDKQLGPLR